MPLVRSFRAVSRRLISPFPAFITVLRRACDAVLVVEVLVELVVLVAAVVDRLVAPADTAVKAMAALIIEIDNSRR